jgi:hypothetical protein
LKNIKLYRPFCIITIWILIIVGFIPYTPYTTFAIMSKVVTAAPLTQNDALSIHENTKGSFTWALPEKLGDLFTPMLTIHPNYRLELDHEKASVVDDLMMTTYHYPIVITEKKSQTPIALLDIHFRHFINGDVSYHLSLSQTYKVTYPADADTLQITAPSTRDLGLTWAISEISAPTDDAVPIKIDDLFQITYTNVINNTSSQWISIQPNVLLQPIATRSDTFVLPKTAIFSNQLRFGMVDIYTLLDANVIVENLEVSPTTLLTKLTGGRKWVARLPLPISETHPTLTEHWGIMSPNHLSPFTQGQDSIIAEDIRIADLNRFRKLRTDGIYYEVPSSYVPYAPRAYWRVPAEHIGQRFVSSIQNQEKRGQQVTNTYLETLSIMSLNHSLPQQNNEGFWITEPKSRWLYDDYGIEAGFYDTRFSTDAALFIMDMYLYYKDKNIEGMSYLSPDESNQLMISLKKYADFLIWYSVRYSFITKNGGLLLQDYYHPTIPHSPTHVSLNHLVTEMNFLLSYSLLLDRQNDSNQKYPYLELASKIRIAVHDTGTHWIKDNHDLWYAYMPDGSYGLLDYPRLTRNDLMISIRLLETVFGEKDQLFQMLVQSKENYLTQTKQPLW